MKWMKTFIGYATVALHNDKAILYFHSSNNFAILKKTSNVPFDLNNKTTIKGGQYQL